jgi:hypothetical protein
VEDSDFEAVLVGSVGRGKSAVIEVSAMPLLRGIGKDDGSVCGRYAVAVCISRLEDM